MGLCCPTGRTEIPISSDSNNNHYTQIIIEAPCPYQPPPRFGRSATLPPNVVIVPILRNPLVDIATLYNLESELGRGKIGITYLGTEKGTGLKYACKAIPRRKLVATKDIESAKREIMILQHLTGHLVELKGAYEDRKTLYLVTEVCSGGELFDRIFIC